jgi:hypothetical protein
LHGEALEVKSLPLLVLVVGQKFRIYTRHGKIANCKCCCNSKFNSNPPLLKKNKKVEIS